MLADILVSGAAAPSAEAKELIDDATEDAPRGSAAPPRSRQEGGCRPLKLMVAATAFASAGLLATWAALRARPPASSVAGSGVSAPMVVSPTVKTSTGCANWDAMVIEVINDTVDLYGQGCKEACDRNDLCYAYNVRGPPCSDEYTCYLFAGFCDEEEAECWDLGYDLQSTLAPHIHADTGCANWEGLLVDTSVKASSRLCEEWCYRYPFGCSSFGFARSVPDVAAGQCYLFKGRCDQEWSPGWDLHANPGDPAPLLPSDAKRDAVMVTEWYSGRLGNQLFTLMNAVIFALGTGRQFVCFPDGDSLGHVREHFFLPYLPACMPIEPWPQALDNSLHCDNKNSSLRAGTFWEVVFRCSFSMSVARSAMQRYVMPLASPALQVSCARAAEKMAVFDGLTIHMRSGDLMGTAAEPGSAFAPCSFFDFVIRHGGFKKVLIVTEPDMSHPCIAPLIFRADIEVTVQSESVGYDGCTLAHAKHLAGGAISSTFAIGFGILMNKNLKTYYGSFVDFGIFDFVWPTHAYGTGGPCSNASQSRLQFYRVDSPYRPGTFYKQGADKYVPQEERMNFITKTTSRDISLDSELCFE